MAVLSLADAKTHLNITTTDHDSELTAVIDAAEAVIADRCGPLESTAKTERLTSIDGDLVLSTIPAISLTSVTQVNGDALTLSDLYLYPESGVVTGVNSSGVKYTVVYAAGRSTCPDSLLLAVKELVRHIWSTQRGSTRRPGSTASDHTSNTLPGAAYLLPFRVSELIAPHLQAGFA